MKTKAMITMLVSVAMILTAPLVALGAKGAPGPPSDGGGGGEPPDYGDLIILYRDADGVPILTETFCQQPISAVEFTGCEYIPGTTDCLIPVDPDTCAVDNNYVTYTQEVDFGRINDARSDVSVFESQLADVIVNLATAACVSLDPAGRLVTSREETYIDENGTEISVMTSAAIDSPLQNLAIYRQLMLTGDLGTSLPDGASVLDTAARALGAGSGKTGWVGVDLVVYLNQIMGLSDNTTTTILEKKCIDVKEEVMGNIELVEKCFLDYGAVPPDSNAYPYHRGNNFEALLPAPAYIPKTKDGSGIPGWFEVLAPIDPDETDRFEQQFAIFRGPILGTVFGSDAGFEGSNIGGFAQAADDTRAVIDYMHSWPLPVDYATPVPCVNSAPNAFDVSISAESGLQVPRNIIDGSEGREFIVTVANASGSAVPANGTVTVTATVAGVNIAGSPWDFEFVNLAVGASESFSALFTVNIGKVTTIDWKAEAIATGDVNTSNNTQTATSNVKVTGGGGGGE
jgi:hypothetical protein